MQARDYQLEAVAAIYRYFGERGGSPLVLMPTGTGKSVVIAEFLRSIYYYFPGQRVIIATHVKELIAQNFDKLKTMWPQAPAGIYSSGLKQRDTLSPITFAGIGSVYKRAAEFGRVDLLIIDEAHLVSPHDETEYRQFIDALRVINPLLKVIGLTATGYRMGQGKLTEGEGALFSDVAIDMTSPEAFRWFFAQGYLIPLVAKQTSLVLNTDGVRMQGGEFSGKQLQLAVDKYEITRAAMQEAIDIASMQGRNRWLIFCAGVEHATHTSEILNDMGISCGAVHSKLGDGERDRILAAHKAGQITAVTNNNVLTTGYDDPGIDLIIMLRPTMSTNLWVQMLGRGTRPLFMTGFDLMTTAGRLASIAASPKHNTLVLDFAGNTRRLGPIDDPVLPRKKGEGTGEAPVRLCDACGCYNHASARSCVICGAEFPPPKTKIEQTASTAAVVSGEMPITEVIPVETITFTKHSRPGRTPTLKVSYYNGLRMFSEFVCLEHDASSFPHRKARQWWRERSTLPVPESVDDALGLMDVVKVATHIRVWTNKQPYPDILAHCFDGTAFSTQEPSGTVPHVQTYRTAKPSESTRTDDDAGIVEDDIPF